MYSINVILDGVEARRRNAGILHVITGFVLILNTKKYLDVASQEPVLHLVPVLLVAATSLVYGFFRRKVDVLAKFNTSMRLLQAVTFLFLGLKLASVSNALGYISVFLFAFVCLLLLFSEKRVFETTSVLFTNDGVSVPGIYKNHLIAWAELSEVVVREDFLTLFHVKKKYLQYRILQNLSIIEIAKINTYCREQIEKHVNEIA